MSSQRSKTETWCILHFFIGLWVVWWWAFTLLLPAIQSCRHVHDISVTCALTLLALHLVAVFYYVVVTTFEAEVPFFNPFGTIAE